MNFKRAVVLLLLVSVCFELSQGQRLPSRRPRQSPTIPSPALPSFPALPSTLPSGLVLPSGYVIPSTIPSTIPSGFVIPSTIPSTIPSVILSPAPASPSPAAPSPVPSTIPSAAPSVEASVSPQADPSASSVVVPSTAASPSVAPVQPSASPANTQPSASPASGFTITNAVMSGFTDENCQTASTQFLPEQLAFFGAQITASPSNGIASLTLQSVCLQRGSGNCTQTTFDVLPAANGKNPVFSVDLAKNTLQQGATYTAKATVLVTFTDQTTKVVTMNSNFVAENSGQPDVSRASGAAPSWLVMLMTVLAVGYAAM